MQDIELCARPRLANALIDSHLLPAGQRFGLVLGQVGLHGKVGLGQIDGGFQVQRHSVDFSQMIDFFHYREQADERPFTTRARPGMARRGVAKALSKRAKKRVQFCDSDFC